MRRVRFISVKRDEERCGADVARVMAVAVTIPRDG